MTWRNLRGERQCSAPDDTCPCLWHRVERLKKENAELRAVAEGLYHFAGHDACDQSPCICGYDEVVGRADLLLYPPKGLPPEVLKVIDDVLARPSSGLSGPGGQEKADPAIVAPGAAGGATEEE
jgi:hypothetical protein